MFSSDASLQQMTDQEFSTHPDFTSRLAHLKSVGERADIDLSDVVCRVVTDHFVASQSHGERAIAEFQTLFAASLGAARAQTHAIVAAKLAVHPQTPVANLRALVACGGEAARIVLMHAHTFDPAILAHHAEHGTSAVAAAIAARGDLSPAIIAILARRLESDVIIALGGNRNAPLDRATLAHLVTRGRRDRALGAALLQRGTLSCDTLPLFMAASTLERARMIRDERRAQLGRPQTLLPQPQLCAVILDHVIQNHQRALRESLTSALRCADVEARALIEDEGGEGFALVLARFGASETQAQQIFETRLAQRANEAERIFMLTRITQQVPPSVAAHILRIVLGSSRERVVDFSRGRDVSAASDVSVKPLLIATKAGKSA